MNSNRQNIESSKLADDINNNIKQVYLSNKGKTYVNDFPTEITIDSSSSSSSSKASSSSKIISDKSIHRTSDKLIDRKSKIQSKSDQKTDDQKVHSNRYDERSSNFDAIETLSSNNADEFTDSQKIYSTSISRDTENGTLSRKQSIVSTDLDKRAKRKTSTVLELKDYDKWTEENELTKSQDQFKRQKQLQTLITKQIDQLPIESNKKKSNKNNKRNHTWFYVFVLAFLILSMVIASNYLEKDSKTKNSLEYRIVFREKELRTFDLLDEDGKQVLTIHYGLKIPKDIKPIKCTKLSKGAKISYFCRDWLHRASLTIGVDNKPNRINCYNIEWSSYTSKEELRDCFELKDGYWFGMGLVRNEPWPLNNWKQKMVAFVTSDHRSEESPFGSIIRRYWLSSNGISISVPLDVPLHMSFNETNEDGKESNQMCFQANLAHYPYDAETSVKLEYSICTGDDLKQLHTYSSKVWSQSSIAFDLDKSPEMEFIRKPIWTTNHLPELNQTVLQKFTKQINDITNVTGFLLIDDRWQNQIGELRINQTNFPNPVDTFKALTNRGWKTILTVSPLINIVSNLLHETAYQKRIIHDMTLQVPLLTKCTPEEHLKFCAVIDIMQLPNGEWLKRRLIDNIISRYSIDGLMFQGVEVSRMPQYHHNQLHNVVNPDYYQVYYIDIAASTSKYIGMTTAAGIKDVQGFLRIPPLQNSWEALRSIIPTVLNLGLVGFSVVNTGSVGGDIILNSKDDELYVRWLELSLFLPIIQFSKVENINLNINNIKTFKKYQHIRKTDLIPVMERCMLDYNQNGWPIIRGLWWLEPDDQDLYLIKDQFAIGDEIVVAPILNKGQTRRNITLPSGVWTDMITLKNEKGGKTLQNYEIGLNQIAYFKRVKEYN